jgi:hypothetical protein
MMTSYGAAQFRRMTVWCDVVGAENAPTVAVGAPTDDADTSAARVVERQGQ